MPSRTGHATPTCLRPCLHKLATESLIPFLGHGSARQEINKLSSFRSLTRTAIEGGMTMKNDKERERKNGPAVPTNIVKCFDPPSGSAIVGRQQSGTVS